MSGQNGDWRSPPFRQKVIVNINEALKKSGTHNGGSAIDIEKHIFQKANTRESYMSMVARIILACTANQKQPSQTTQPINTGPMLESNITPTPMMSQEALKTDNSQILNKILMQPSPMSNMLAPSPQFYQTPSPVTMVTQGKQTKQPQARTPQMNPVIVGYPSPSPIIPSPNIPAAGHSPAPASSPQFAQSPSSIHATRVSGIPSVESPGSFNPPSNPGSQESPVKLSDKEEQLYVEKLKQLSVYTEPLRKMIAKTQNDEDKDSKNLAKLKRVLGILGNPKERVPYQALLKVENVLVRIFGVKSSTAPIGQSLLQALSAKADSPQSNNTLYRMFAPTFSTIYGPPICPPIAPKRRPEERNNDNGLPQIVKCEIAQLASRFTITHNTNGNEDCEKMTLICSINDKTLPAVPSLSIRIPEDYPYSSPCCDTKDYDSTLFLKKVKDRLHKKLSGLSRIYSLTSLLLNWESCLRYVNARNGETVPNRTMHTVPSNVVG